MAFSNEALRFLRFDELRIIYVTVYDKDEKHPP